MSLKGKPEITIFGRAGEGPDKELEDTARLHQRPALIGRY